MTAILIKEKIHTAAAETIALRRELHQHPELSWQEFETTKRIESVLQQIGIPYRKTEPTGLIAEIKGRGEGKTVALRADIDALPVQEVKITEYRSKNLDRMHACGHDAHTAMLLSAAKVLYDLREAFEGNVRLIFQPAEEVGQGALKMIEQGALNEVDNVFGLHIWSQLATGTISCSEGAVFAAADTIVVRFHGKGGHGGIPQDCIDVAVVASSFVMNVQAIVARECSPFDTVVITIGKMAVGVASNIISDSAVLEGTVRTFDSMARHSVEVALRRYAEHVAAMYNATVEVEYRYGTLPVLNEKESALRTQALVIKEFGQQTLISAKPLTVAEDFCYYLDNCSGCYALVGSGNREKETDWAHHHERFDIDEDALVIGAELFAQYAFHYLTEK